MNAIPKQIKDLANETILSTPQPTASSTVERQIIPKKLRLNKIPLNYSPNASETSVESLQLLSLDNLQVSHLSTGDVSTAGLLVTNEKLQEQRNLANSVLQKSTAKGLPSRYLVASETMKNNSKRDSNIYTNESTVNESELLQSFSKLQDEKLSFTPAEISTPRSSNASDSDDNSFASPRHSLGLQMSKNLAELYKQIRFSDASLADLCNKFQKLNSLANPELELNNESFMSGELAAAKISECEKSWQKQHDVLGGNSIKSDSIFQQSKLQDVTTNPGGVSITEFFRKKSELADLCFKTSPEKSDTPAPLIDKSDCSESMMSSILQKDSACDSLPLSTSLDISTLSLTEIEKAISSNDNTTKIVDLMFEKASTAKTTKASDCWQEPDDYKENQTSLKNNLSKISTNTDTILKDTQNLTNNDRSCDASSNKSLTSVRTVSSLECLPGGKLPIESTRTELVWGCVQVGKRQIQTFVLRNRSQSKLKMQISSTSTSFKILNDHCESDAVSILPILLHPSESRSFSVMFTPSTVGGMAEKLKFSPISNELQIQQTKRQLLLLYGYGGHANVEVSDVPKDTNMKMWLSLGKLDGTLQLTKKFTVRNTGILPAFVCLSFCSKVLYTNSRVTFYPTQLILKPKERVVITISYIPTKDDAKHVFAITNNQVIEIGFIQLITGEDVLRGRIRRLYKKLKHESKMTSNPLVEKLSGKFPNEQMPLDLHKFAETVGCMKELMQNLVSREIVLTLERDSDHTLLGQIAEMENTSMFQSLAEGMSTIIANRGHTISCMVEPTRLVLTPPIKTEDTVLITNQFSSILQFETTAVPDGILKVIPPEGILSPNETSVLRVVCDVKKIQQPQQVLRLFIYVDDDVLEVDVKIISLKSNSFK